MNWNLIAKYISNECTKEERKLVEARVQSDPDFAYLLKTLQTSTSLHEKPSRPIDVQAMWQEFQQKANTQNRYAAVVKSAPLRSARAFGRSMRLSPAFRLAAMLIITISASLLISNGWKSYSTKTMIARQYETVNVKNGGRLNISLSDGTQVTVDAGSEFKYFTSYENERHVYLEGEAIFDVAHDADRPFFVHSGNAVIRVVGTRFNVRSWDTNPDVVVTVAEGRVLVGMADSLQIDPILLTIGEQSIVTTDSISPKKYVDPEKYFSWMKNEICFENAKVKEVVSQLERWYDFKFEFEEPQALEQEITVQIRWANINEVNQIISLVTGTDFVRDGKVIRFSQKKDY